ncbi:shootin-1-like isoform X1 [Prorops nasuta]|uniref:shootin-1-like isoform X1 n=1 Tax=Prorops nasuta TaxID=863751 RepID=UPI0034CE463A
MRQLQVVFIFTDTEDKRMNKTELNIFLSSEPGRASQNAVHSHIPVPRISNGGKAQERHPPKRRGSFEKLGRTTSVAAQRASFEKLDAASSFSNSNSNFISNSTSNLAINQANPYAGVQLRSTRTNNPIFQSVELRNHEEKAGSNCSFKRNEVPRLNRTDSFSENKWKSKYEESEKRRKLLLQKNEAINKDHTDLERKYQQLHKQNNTLQTQVQEKELKLVKLRTVSEAVCKEYEELKNRYDVETTAMHKAMQQASQWYKQNRELKRRSQVITQKFMQISSDGLDIDVSDEVDSNFEEFEQLRETVSDLSQEIAKLRTELNAARIQEFEAQEQVTLLMTQLEEERCLREKRDEQIKELKVHKENMERVTKMVADEVQALKVQCDRERETAMMIKIEADRVQKERNVLAHQSALLMAEINEDPNGRLLLVLQEVESLKRLLEEEKQNHIAQIQILHEKLEEKESNVEFEIVEEKLKLSESELEVVVERAERAEKRTEELEQIVKGLKEKNSELEQKLSRPPPPPLPPPPPPPPIFNNNQLSSIKLLTTEKASSENRVSAVADMENMLGISKKAPAIVQQPVIDDIINQIKGGRFTLKQTDKQRAEERKRRQEAESAPPAVSEMLNILGTMRRRAKPTRQSFKFSESPAQ